MTKRKAELDLSEEESAGKKLREDAPSKLSLETKEPIRDIMEGLTTTGLVDYSNDQLAKKNYSDMTIVSSDEYVLKYHRHQLVKYPFFEDLISVFTQKEKECKIELLLFSGQTINLMLNYIDNADNLDRKHIVGCRVKTWINIYELANYANLKSLGEHCCYMMEKESQIGTHIVECYIKHKLYVKKLMPAVLEGEYDDGQKFPVDFLSQCFDFAVSQRRGDFIVTYLLQIYCPNNEQMKLFGLSFRHLSYDTTQVKVSVGGPKGVSEISNETLANFRAKYLNMKNNPEGVDKFMRRIAELCFERVWSPVCN